MMKKIAYISILTSLIGVSAFSIDLGIFQLSLFRAIIILMVIGLLIRLLLKNGKITFINKDESNYSIMVMISWLIYAMISLGWVKDYGDWFRALYFISLGVLCIILYSRIFKTTDDILVVFRLLSIMAIVHNVIGWYEINTGNYIFLSTGIEQYVRNNYPVSMFNNTNDFALFMLMSIFFLYVCAVNSKNVLWKIINIITIFSSAYLLIITGSRANILGFVLAFSLYIYMSMKNKSGRRTMLTILILLFIFILINPNALQSYIIMINQNFNSDLVFGSDSVRINLIKNGFEFLLNTFGFGTGAGNIEYWMENYGTYYTGGIVNIHNWWMEILTGYGIVIFVLYITFYLRLFRSLYRKYRTTKDKKNMTISLALMCCMAGFVIGSISSSSNISSEWLWVFWAVAIAFQGISTIIEK